VRACVRACVHKYVRIHSMLAAIYYSNSIVSWLVRFDEMPSWQTFSTLYISSILMQTVCYAIVGVIIIVK